MPEPEAHDIFICVGVFIHREAEDVKTIPEYSHYATRQAIERAVTGQPRAASVVAQRNTAKHPFGAS